MFIILFLLNYFWLSLDPKESASWYCDQHCFKIHSEIIESVWDAVLALDQSVNKRADDKGISKTYRHRRHAKLGQRWHPLSAWNIICKANAKRSLLNAKYIFIEHYKRRNVVHKAFEDYLFLTSIIDDIDYNANSWYEWQKSQTDNKQKDTPSSIWIKKNILNTKNLDRNILCMTPPPECIDYENENFRDCKGDTVVESYRNYYIAKKNTISGGMRYYYTKPPEWLGKDIHTQRKTKKNFKN